MQWCKTVFLPFTALVPLFFLTGCKDRLTPVDIANREQILLIGNGTDPEDLDPQVTTGLPEPSEDISLN